MELRVKPETEVRFNLTDDQIELMHMLLTRGWKIKTDLHDLLKGKLRFRKKGMQVRFDYINNQVINENGFIVLSFISLDELSNNQIKMILEWEG